jgi:FHS family L-fucose permease-like MFS transporter
MAKSRSMVVLVFLTFFVMSLLTNILGPVVPDVIGSFHVNLTAAGFLAFSFFIAYGVMSIPAGFLVERFHEKPVMILAFIISLAGALSFAVFPGYRVAMASFFVIGAGMALLQVAINPLLRVSGGEENYAFNSSLSQVVFGSASFLSPRIYSRLIYDLQHPSPHQSAPLRLLGHLVPAALPWVSIYWLFAACTLFMILLLIFFRFPAVQHTDEESAGTWAIYRTLLKKRPVWLYFFAMFCYSGCEQGTADWMSNFLSTYHHFDPHTIGTSCVSWFWGLLTAGSFVGLLLLKMYDSRKILIGTSIGAMCCLSAALFGPANVSLFAFPLIGLFASVMWAIIISLALNSVADHHGPLSGIVSTAFIGGAIIPLIIGHIGDYIGLRSGMMFLYATFGFVLSVGFWSRPLIQNAILSQRREKAT